MPGPFIGGANPPPGLEWQMGKMPAAIQFVRDAEAYIQQNPHSPRSVVLRSMVADVKTGDMNADNYTSLEDFFNS